MKSKAKCCVKFETEAKVCKKCPLLAGCGKKKRKKLLAEILSDPHGWAETIRDPSTTR